MPFRRVAITTICVTVSISGFCSAATAATSHRHGAASVVLSPNGLPSILKTYDRLNNQANQTLNTTLLNEFEMGSAAQVDDAGYLLDADAGYRTEEGATYKPFNVQLVDGAVPHQTSYPALAVAVVRGSPSKCSGSGFLDVFEKSSATASWKLDYEPLVDAGSVPKLATTTGGYAVLATSGKGLRTDPASVPAAFESDLSSYVLSGSLGSLPKTVLGTKSQCWSLFTLRSVFEAIDAQGFEATYSGPVTPTDLVALRTANGGAVAMFTIGEALTDTASAGYYIPVTPTAGDPSSYIPVPAGNYSSITYSYLLEVAVEIPPATLHRSAPFTVIGVYGGSLPGSGTPGGGP